MEQSGEAPEPEQPAAQPTSSLPPPTSPPVSAEPGPPDQRGFLIAGILALVLVVGAIAWMARPADGLVEVDRDAERFPSPTTVPLPTTLPVPPSVAPATVTPVVVTAPPPTAAATTTVPVAVPGSTVQGEALGTTTATIAMPPDDPDQIATLVPNLAAFAEFLSTPELAKAEVDQMLSTGRHDIAVAGPVASICAAIPMDRPLAARGRWERDGRRIASTDLDRRDAPGFGECLTDDGDALDDGSYQYIAADSNGNESAAGGIVVGSARIDQRLRNDGVGDICSVRIAPSVSRYFEVYVYAARPITPGTEITLAVAELEQDVETVGCDDELLASFSFQPAAATVQSLTP